MFKLPPLILYYSSSYYTDKLYCHDGAAAALVICIPLHFSILPLPIPNTNYQYLYWPAGCNNAAAAATAGRIIILITTINAIYCQ